MGAETSRRWRNSEGKTNVEELSKSQQEDKTIPQWMSKEDPTRIIQKNGVLLRVCHPNQEWQQIVLPQKYIQRVLELAHYKPMAGHMGALKTRQRLLKRFFLAYYMQRHQRLLQTMPRMSAHGQERKL